MNELTEKQETWAWRYQFYQELIDKYRWKQAPMLHLMDQLKGAGFHDEYYASGSHEALGISTAAEYTQRLQTRMVYIIYNSVQNKFELHYQSGQGATVHRAACTPEFVVSQFDVITSWLTEGKR